MAENSGYRSRVASGRPGAGSLSSRLTAIEDRIFTARRLKFYGSGVLVGVILAVLLQWARGRGHWVVGPDGRLGSIDFCWIWVSGKFAAFADPARIYDRAMYAASHNVFYPPGQCLFLPQYVYPPTFLFFTWPLGYLPHLAAYAAWATATLALYLIAVYAIIPSAAALFAALMSAGALNNLQLGHNGFLTAGLIGLWLTLAERRPWFAGICLGLLTVKPQFGVLFPLALIASRNWRAFIGAGAASLAFGAAAALVFGWRTWPAFLGFLLDRNANLSPQPGASFMLESVYGLLHAAGAAGWLAWGLHLATALAAAVAVYVVWARPLPLTLKAAVLCAATLLVSPYILPYDLTILSVAAAFLVRDGLDRGFLVGERLIVLAGSVVLYFALAVGPIVAIALLVLAMRRTAIGGRFHLAVLGGSPVASSMSSAG